MTICIATPNYLPDTGGITTFNMNLSGLLQQAGHKVIILTVCYKNNSNDEDELSVEENGLIVVRLRKRYRSILKKNAPYFKPGGLDAPNWIALGIAMREWLLLNHKTYNIDVIETTDYGGLGIFLCDEKLPPIIITGHGSLTQLSKINYKKNDSHYKVIIELERISFQYADMILASSRLNQDDLAKTFKRVTHFATAPWDMRQFGNTQTSENGYPLIIAGMQIVKGTITMVEALNIIIKKQPSFAIEWVGSDFNTAPGGGSTSKYLEKKFPHLWNQKFFWRNSLNREDTRRLLIGTSMVIIPSVFDTFNYVAIEAATLGKSIIMTEKTGASYLFTHKHNAWIIPADDPEKLAEGILYLEKNPEIRKKLGSNAQIMAKMVFDRERIVEERIEIYHLAIDTRKIIKHSLEGEMAFLKNYINPARKAYYRLRVFLKRILKGRS